MRKIVIIQPYFGKFPTNFNLWLKSCAFNKDIHFLLVTDQNVIEVPQNFTLIKMSFSDVQNLVNKKMNCEVCLNRPYKLCDLKPMYGVIFSDYIEEYDYWGHCDMDLIFGDLNYYFEKFEIDKYDKFLNLGHLSLYKNTETIKYAFKLAGSKCGNWQDVISSTKSFAFDELNGIYQIFINNNLRVFDKRIYADISTRYKRIKLALLDKNYNYQVFYWENGKVYRTYWESNQEVNDEFIYIHFQKRAMQEPDFDVNKSNAFYICPNGFAEKEVNICNKNDVQRFNSYKGEIYEKLELLFFNIKDLYRRIKNRLLHEF